MYQGAQPSTAGKSPNPGGKKKKRRSKKKKKNPATVTWILIAGGAAVATGVVTTVLVVRSKRKKAAALITAGNGELPSGKKPSAPTSKNAPKFPYTTAEAKMAEAPWATAMAAEAWDPGTGTMTMNVEDITDAAFWELYQIRKIPKGYNKTWQPYVDSWLRLRTLVRAQVAAYTGSAVS